MSNFSRTSSNVSNVSNVSSLSNARPLLVTGAGGPAAQSLLFHGSLGSGPIFGADCDPHAPGLLMLDPSRRLVVPRADAPDFAQVMLELCRIHEIGVLWPTVDAELLPLASMRTAFEAAGIRLVLPSIESLERTLDKAALMRALMGKIPLVRFGVFDETFEPGQEQRWILKPRRGAGSRGIETHTLATLRERPRDANFLAQALLPGSEFSVDVFISRSGRHERALARTRGRTDSGISTMSQVVFDQQMETMAIAAGRGVGLTGIMNVQFKQDTRGRPRLLEINPRVPGGMPLAIAAGWDMPNWVLADLFEEPLEVPKRPRQLCMVRRFTSEFIEATHLSIPTRAQRTGCQPAPDAAEPRANCA